MINDWEMIIKRDIIFQKLKSKWQIKVTIDNNENKDKQWKHHDFMIGPLAVLAFGKRNQINWFLQGFNSSFFSKKEKKEPPDLPLNLPQLPASDFLINTESIVHCA